MKPTQTRADLAWTRPFAAASLAVAFSIFFLACPSSFSTDFPFAMAEGERIVDIVAGRDACLVAVEAEGGTTSVIALGSRLGPYDAVGAMSAASSGDRWHFVARKAGEYFAISESGVEGPYSAITIEDSGEGRVEYYAESPEGSWVRTRERLSGPFPGARVTSAKTGERAAFIIEDSSGARVCFGSSTEGPFDSVSPSVRLSADASRAAYAFERDGAMFARWSGEERGPFYQAAAVVSEDGRSVAIAYASDDGTLGLESKLAGRGWESVALRGAVGFGGAVIGRDGSLSYALQFPDGIRIYHAGGEVPGAFSDVSRWLAFDAGWSAVAMAADGYWYVRNGATFGPFDRVVRSGLSGDLDYVVGLDAGGKAWVVVDGIKRGPWAMVGDVTPIAGDPGKAIWPASEDGVSWKAWTGDGPVADLGERFFVRRVAARAGSWEPIAAEFVESDCSGESSTVRFLSGASGERSTAAGGSLLNGLTPDGAWVSYWRFSGDSAAEPCLLSPSGERKVGIVTTAADGRIVVATVESRDGRLVVFVRSL